VTVNSLPSLGICVGSVAAGPGAFFIGPDGRSLVPDPELCTIKKY